MTYDVVTGAAGFIGSCLIGKLNSENFNAVIAVDKFDHDEKNLNLQGKKIIEKVDRNEFFSWLDVNFEEVEFIFTLEPEQIPPSSTPNCYGNSIPTIPKQCGKNA